MSNTPRFGFAPIRPGLKKVDNQGTFPAYHTVSSGITYTTNGKTVTLSGPPNANDIEPGDVLYSSGQNQCRRIVKINRNGTLEIDEAFDANVAAEDVKIVKASDLVRGIGIKVTGAADAVVDGTTVTVTDPAINYSDENGVSAVAYDATGTEIMIAINH